MMAADTMEALGIPRGSYVVKVNNRKVLDGVMESDRARRRGECGDAAHGAAGDRQAGSVWAEEVRKLLGPTWDGGEEGKGDFTKGAEFELVSRLTHC